MDQSRRAVESYWRSRMIDGATADEDKVTPVYKLDEICDLLRSSHASIVKEVSEFIVKRLEHKSPIVKQKALRIVKYAVGKSGAEFKREIQRNSVAIRQLIHYKGQPDPLKGDALNKAVRETAKEALSVLFTSDDTTAAPTESSLRSRIQGFGSTNYEAPTIEDKRSFISEVVDIGSATIKQGLSSLTQSQSQSLRRNDDAGSYKSPYLRRSLTREMDYSDQYGEVGSEPHIDARNTSRSSVNSASASWGRGASQSEQITRDSSAVSEHKTREQKLLETIVTSGGVRLQPTRDALNAFLVEASKLNPESLGHAIELKLQSPHWQVRMKALCVLDAVLRKKHDSQFSVVASYFSKNKDLLVRCSDSPQASLREKAVKVLSMLENGLPPGDAHQISRAAEKPQPSALPDLIDTGDDTLEFDAESTKKAVTSSAPLINDLLGGDFGAIEDDPFSDVSFHSSSQVGDEEIGDDKLGADDPAPRASEPFDLLDFRSHDSNDDRAKEAAAALLDGLSVNGHGLLTAEMDRGNMDSGKKAGGNAEFGSSQAANSGFLIGGMTTSLASQAAVNYNAMYFQQQQQQLLAVMTNFHHQAGNRIDAGSVSGYSSSSSPLPDIFNPGTAIQPPTSTLNASKREETKAFDFISDHLAASRDAKRMI
ncbi:hypothetical protein M569_04182 [Genlisea aurea]|uniref:VHS domain-containing protein n=1 Tax=Genlisea aurea TaxID=192259 RepID=S8CZP7_9LAMI|nr:hypothetical protein M569_04182 [Genlisea aurea]